VRELSTSMISPVTFEAPMLSSLPVAIKVISDLALNASATWRVMPGSSLMYIST